MDRHFVFTGVADAVTPDGFAAICGTAIKFIEARFQCKARFFESEFVRAFDLWTQLAMPLPLESYSWQKRHLLTVAVLIQAISGCKIVEFNNSESDDAKLPGQHPNELLGLVMGLILHDISLRTEKNVSAKIRYAPLDTISGAEIRAAIEVMIDKSRSNHRRRFAKLVKILGHFKTPITLH